MTTSHAAKEFCRTALAYIPRDGGGGAPETPILDGRTADLPGWKDCGFELLQHSSEVLDWDDDDEIARVHYAEICELAKQQTGCDHALLNSHIRRSPEAVKKHSDFAPIPFVHSDFADSYGDLLREIFRTGERSESLDGAGITGEDVAAAKRLMILQFWRNIGPAKMDMPLAFCDARTITRDDVRTIPVKNYANSGIDFEALAIVAPVSAEDHHWYVFPEMQRDEVAAFRTYDTDMVTSGETYWTPHCAIHDPEVERGKPARSSIELRATCVWL